MNTLHLKTASPNDLENINAIVVAAIQTWQLVPRLARLVAVTHQYESSDFLTMNFYFLCLPDLTEVGIMALEPQPDDHNLLLHGLYILPDYQNQGLGRQALNLAKEHVVSGGFRGLLVKAHASARNFFAQQTLTLLPIKNPERDYPHRYFWSVEAPDDRLSH